MGSITYPESTINMYPEIVSTPPVSASKPSYLTLADLQSSIKSPIKPFQDEEIFTLLGDRSVFQLPDFSLSPMLARTTDVEQASEFELE